MRVSAYRSTWTPNKRPYVTLTPDMYVRIQGETTIIGCGECRREINLNRYVVSVSTEASVDSPPGSATVSLAIPDHDVNQFYANNQFLIIPMMEIEVYSKGYYTIGGFPQYYRIFWGVVSSVTESWSNGVTNVSLSCKDILRWWEVTNVTLNPAFLDNFGGSAGNFQLFGNQFAGANPYTVILALAREAMGDFSLTTGSFTSFQPEKGAEAPVIADYAKDIMAYWQLKFGNIWNSLVLYGTSGQAYVVGDIPGNQSILQISKQIAISETVNRNLNPATSQFTVLPSEQAVFKVELDKAANIDFFQTDSQSKLSIAQTARDQAGFEFYCDTTGDIVFKPPFYNLNVLANKPVSWIQDFEIIDDSVTESEAEVVTHLTGSGNAFGGIVDPGLSDEITTPRTGVIDYHLLKRYGWRRQDLQLEWTGNPVKHFFYLLDHLDRLNAKRSNGTVTIPLRPELRMGFPIWFPKYDSFFYIQGISHNFAPGGQATTTLQLIAKRSKFIAPKNIGIVSRTKSSKQATPPPQNTTVNNVQQNVQNQKNPPKPPPQQLTVKIEFPTESALETGFSQETTTGGQAVIRSPKTGKLLGFPNAVMVYHSAISGTQIDKLKLPRAQGKLAGNKPGTGASQKKGSTTPGGPSYDHDHLQKDLDNQIRGGQRAEAIARARATRYEAAMSNAGAYDYAHDKDGLFKELAVVPTDSVTWNAPFGPAFQSVEEKKQQQGLIAGQIGTEVANQVPIFGRIKQASADLANAQKILSKTKNDSAALNARDIAQAALNSAKEDLVLSNNIIASIKTNSGLSKVVSNLNILIRPVSDEFGFELIGHYRYGRGAVMDRGQVKVNIGDQAKPNIINQLNIQFAPTGGLLDDISGPVAGQESVDYFKSLEQMQPEDYVTGASFKGTGLSSSTKLADVNMTSQNTYTNAVNRQDPDVGHAFFIEADALRRAKTLGDLSPTINIPGISEQSNNCQCILQKTDWLTVLPQSVLDTILKPEAATISAEVVPGEGNEVFLQNIRNINAVSDASANAPKNVQGSPSGEDFFKVLNEFLVKKFASEYQSGNTVREAFDLDGGRVAFSTEPGADNGTLQAPGGSLFDRAALGDPTALAALQNQANFNFGLSNDALKNFQNVVSSAGDSVNQSLADLKNSFQSLYNNPLSGAPVTGAVNPPQVQPPAPNQPSPINPSQFESASNVPPYDIQGHTPSGIR